MEPTHLIENVRAIGDILIVERLSPREQTAAGIILPPVAQESPDAGIVRSAGPGKRLPKFLCGHCKKHHEGAVLPMSVKVGDHVLFSKYANLPFKYGEREYITMHEADIIGILDKDIDAKQAFSK